LIVTNQRDVLREIGVESHIAIFGFENVRELVEEHLFVWELAIYRVIPFTA
jgi:hypothetical protein